MRIIISPAKKMNVDTDSLDWRNLPALLDRTQLLCDKLKSMSGLELKRLWKCSEQIAALNEERVRGMDLRSRLTPAILSYEGIQYQYMAPGVFTNQEYEYVEEHLRILSGFYGVLRPFDGVTPYRLEMQAKLSVGQAKDLYAFWGNTLANVVCADTDCVLNLASKEYSVCISGYAPASVRLITCVFGEEQGGKVVEKGTICKMARGEMVRYMAENSIKRPEDVRAFDRLHFRYEPEYSSEGTYVFLRHLPRRRR